MEMSRTEYILSADIGSEHKFQEVPATELLLVYGSHCFSFCFLHRKNLTIASAIFYVKFS